VLFFNVLILFVRSFGRRQNHGVFNLWISPFMTCVRLLENKGIVLISFTIAEQKGFAIFESGAGGAL
jgi:hypothetical protein